MPRLRVIILDQSDAGPFRAALWADVPAARQPFYARLGTVSEWKEALPADNAALAAGQVAERVVTVRRVEGWTGADIRTELQTRWQQHQTYVTAFNSWSFYGSTWDANGVWTTGGVS